MAQTAERRKTAEKVSLVEAYLRLPSLCQADTALNTEGNFTPWRIKPTPLQQRGWTLPIMTQNIIDLSTIKHNKVENRHSYVNK